MPSLRLGVGVREDVITLWEELDEARNTLAEIQALLCEIKDPKETPSKIVFCFGEESKLGIFFKFPKPWHQTSTFFLSL